MSEPSASTVEVPDRSGRIKRRTTARVMKALEGELRDDEELKACFYCQKYASILWAFLGWLPYFLMAGARYVAASEKRVFLLKAGFVPVFSDDLDQVELVRLRKGLFNDKVVLSHAGRDVHQLRVARNFRNEVDVLLELLRTSAAAGPPQPAQVGRVVMP